MKPGPTGDFPDGKIDETDDGGLNMAILADSKNGIVRLEFGKPVAWIGIPPDVARKLGAMLIQKANELDEE
jgi:hypothetical protein